MSGNERDRAPSRDPMGGKLEANFYLLRISLTAIVFAAWALTKVALENLHPLKVKVPKRE